MDEPRTEAELAARCDDAGDELAAAVRAGRDPLGEAFCRLRSTVQRRARGATYTPRAVIDAMTAWAAGAVEPARVVDPGTGSGRFLVAAAARFPRADLVGVEIDPLAARVARTNLVAAGAGARARVVEGDYRTIELGAAAGPTLFVGNPPYVRHHELDAAGKRWLRDAARARGLRASRLAGLHVHFFVATLAHARPGDVGAFITSAEWLDVNYGAVVRALLAGPLGVCRLDVIDPRVRVFDDAQTTAVIACFRVGAAPAHVAVRRVRSLAALAPLAGGAQVARAALAASHRWTSLGRTRRRSAGTVELGELCRVHRGQVTGANAVWIAAPDTPAVPRAWLRPTVTRARELLDAGGVLADARGLRRVIDLPRELDAADARIAAFLRWARARGADAGYVARHREPWWAVRLREPAPILVTYMARRPPAFVRNLAGARHINIAHGLYPRDPLAPAQLDALARHLAATTQITDGRTYAGGLTKFEPGELERLRVPAPATLR